MKLIGRQRPLSLVLGSGLIAKVAIGGVMVVPSTAEARTCKQLRSLCYGMRSDNNDCAAPYQRCLRTGVFITPLGRGFKATK